MLASKTTKHTHPCFKLYAEGKPLDACRSLQEDNADPCTTNAAGRTLLHIAAAKGDVHAVRYFLQLEGMRCDVEDNFGLSPLDLASSEAVVFEMNRFFNAQHLPRIEDCGDSENKNEKLQHSTKKEVLPSAKLLSGDPSGEKTMMIASHGFPPHLALAALRKFDFDEKRALISLCKDESNESLDYPSSTVSPENAGVFLQKLNKDLVLMTPRKRDRFAEPPRRPQSGALTDYREEVDFLKL